jgi:hypothetical protein
MIVECPYCESKVDCEEKGEVAINDDDVPFPMKAVLVECRVCHHPLFGWTELIQTGEDSWEWGELTRQWPVQETEIDWEIPEIARISLIEAKVCFKAKAFSACAVMCGRTIEGVCKHHDPKTRNLANGLKKLKDDGVIDSRLYEWGEALRNHRNLGAHATTVKVSKDDARDLLDFSIAICEYVFVLNEKFQRFQARQQKA